MNHTPGPWQQIATKHRTLISSQEGHRVAECESLSEADARLIAAAPELIAMLIRLVGAIDRMPSNSADGLADIARELIAKATGSAA